MEELTLAVPDGRLWEPTWEYLRRSGLVPDGAEAPSSRDLVFRPRPGLRLLRVRPADVAVYVAWGAADAGIVGRDVLLEQEPDVYELADLGFGQCRIVLAAPAGLLPERVLDDGLLPRPLRVATKYPRLVRRLLLARGWTAEVVALSGHVEVAPRVGLADAIVDLVDTGRTLAENGLAVVAELERTSARLIANPVAYRVKRSRLQPLLAGAAGPVSLGISRPARPQPPMRPPPLRPPSPRAAIPRPEPEQSAPAGGSGGAGCPARRSAWA